MEYPELTLFDKFGKSGIKMVFLLDHTYYELTFPDIVAFVSVSNEEKTTKPIEFPEGEYMVSLDDSDFLKSFKDDKNFKEGALHYAIKCQKITIHIISNTAPVARSKKED